jgi:hypothetical protein
MKIEHLPLFRFHNRGPLRYFLFREIRLRAEALGRSVPLHEDHVVEVYAARC